VAAFGDFGFGALLFVAAGPGVGAAGEDGGARCSGAEDAEAFGGGGGGGFVDGGGGGAGPGVVAEGAGGGVDQVLSVGGDVVAGPAAGEPVVDGDGEDGGVGGAPLGLPGLAGPVLGVHAVEGVDVGHDDDGVLFLLELADS